MTGAASFAIARNLGRPETVLDLACGTGEVGRIARLRGARVTGLDASKAAIQHARGVLDEVHVCGVDPDEISRAVGERTFDLVVVGEALEESTDPRKLLRHVASLLNDGGHVLVSLPRAMSRAEAARMRDSASNDPPLSTLRDAGFEVVRLDLAPVVVGNVRSLVERATRTGEGEAEVVSFRGVVVARLPPVKRKLSLTVGMLTLNEETSVERMIDAIREQVPDATLLLVDSSTDRTPELARAKGATVIRQAPPRGHGPALEMLMYEAAVRTEALVYIDCDFTYPTNVIPRIRELLEEGADVVNASRTHHYPKAMPIPNFLANRFFAAATQLVHGVPTTDVHSGMRGYRSSVIKAFDFRGAGDALPVDTLILPARSNYRVLEVPIPYYERVGQSKLAKLRGTAWTFARIAMSVGEGERVRRDRNYRHVEL